MDIGDIGTDQMMNAVTGKLLTFPDPQQISLSIRASALIFADPESKNLLSLIERVAPSDATAYIKGETGTGKELVARHIHSLSSRRGGPFAAINCGAFSESLVESELFGYERGAFTGSRARMVARCSSTRLAICRFPPRSSCCAYCRNAKSCA
jgi:transcriptional regulator with PAS, ATPase and Fis domain